VQKYRGRVHRLSIKTSCLVYLADLLARQGNREMAVIIGTSHTNRKTRWLISRGPTLNSPITLEIKLMVKIANLL
jgi:hypothetical protein